MDRVMCLSFIYSDCAKANSGGAGYGIARILTNVYV